MKSMVTGVCISVIAKSELLTNALNASGVPA
jgi:hypothetical protein